MQTSELAPKLLDQLEKLKQKYDAMGQDLSSYLDGLLHSNYLTYWDYIHLDTLLSLQNPKTDFPDEKIFIVYHQITELYFNLVLHEIEQLGNENNLTLDIFKKRIKRINSYFRNLSHSFEIMVDGMDREQFLNFRMSLLPSSGFQSVQYRKIEICSTKLIHLVAHEKREELASKHLSTQELLEFIYWKNGATELATGKKTLTLLQFETKYIHELLALAARYEKCNLEVIYQQRFASENDPELIKGLKEYDFFVNVQWPLAHYKSAMRYLNRDPDVISATGGTNWQKYLPPRFQRRIFFPSLWSKDELENWGKNFFLSV